jgi:hypothetical protein
MVVTRCKARGCLKGCWIRGSLRCRAKVHLWVPQLFHFPSPRLSHPTRVLHTGLLSIAFPEKIISKSHHGNRRGIRYFNGNISTPWLSIHQKLTPYQGSFTVELYNTHAPKVGKTPHQQHVFPETNNRVSRLARTSLPLRREAITTT